jgi:hypothetical protein
MEDHDQYVHATNIANEICNEFKRKLEKEFRFSDPLETTLCKDIHTKIYGRYFDLRDPAQREAFLAAGGHSDDGCYKVCGIAAEVAAERLLELM